MSDGNRKDAPQSDEKAGGEAAFMSSYRRGQGMN